MDLNDCRECRKPMVRSRRAVRYQGFGLGLTELILEGIWVETCEHCGLVTPNIPDRNELKSAVALLLVTDRRQLSTAEFRFLRQSVLELDPEGLARRMGLQRETIERWEMGTDPIGRFGERLLRLMVYCMERRYEEEEPGEMLETLAELNEGVGGRRIRLRLSERTVYSWSPCEDRGHYGPPV